MCRFRTGVEHWYRARLHRAVPPESPADRVFTNMKNGKRLCFNEQTLAAPLLGGPQTLIERVNRNERNSFILARLSGLAGPLDRCCYRFSTNGYQP